MSRKIEDYLLESVNPTTKINTKRTFAHIAAIVSRGKVLSVATNRMGSRSNGPGYFHCTIHAEMDAIKKLGDNTKLRGADLYVWRFSPSTGATLNSKPCPKCECVLRKCQREYGLRHIFYTTGQPMATL